jgi:hypothetical protein
VREQDAARIADPAVWIYRTSGSAHGFGKHLGIVELNKVWGLSTPDTIMATSWANLRTPHVQDPTLLTAATAKRAAADAEKIIAAENCAAEVAARAAAEERYQALCAQIAELQRRKDQIDTWVSERGSDNQRKRHELGLLPEKEILDAMRGAAFSSLDSFPRYAKLSKSDIDCICEERVNEAFDVSPASEATAAEFEALDAIATAVRADHPNAAVTLLDHSAWCKDCYDKEDDGKMTNRDVRTLHRKSVRVEITVGALTFSREYAV